MFLRVYSIMADSIISSHHSTWALASMRQCGLPLESWRCWLKRVHEKHRPCHNNDITQCQLEAALIKLIRLPYTRNALDGVRNIEVG